MFSIEKQPSIKNIYIWNALGSGFNAFLSIILLMMVNQLLGPVDGGIFSIGIATAQLMGALVNYEIPTYQVTDTKNKFNFGNYVSIRVLLTILAIIISLVTVVIKGYDIYKAMIVIMLCVYKSAESFSTVFSSVFQKKERLDIAGISLVYRSIILTAVFFISIYISKDLLIGVSALTIGCILWITIRDGGYSQKFERFRFDFRPSRMWSLLIECFPLFAGSFMLTYICNQPKYAIDSLFSEEIQNMFGIIIMPASVINLLSIFIFRPVITKLSNEWNNAEVTNFRKSISKLYFYILIITLVCVAGAYFLGIPVLSMLYGVDLSSCKIALCIILIGGGMSAASTLTYNLIAIMRKQNYMLIAYLVSFLFSFLITKPIVAQHEILGAAVSYLISMAVITLLLVIVVIYFIAKSLKKTRNEKDKS